MAAPATVSGERRPSMPLATKGWEGRAKLEPASQETCHHLPFEERGRSTRRRGERYGQRCERAPSQCAAGSSPKRLLNKRCPHRGPLRRSLGDNHDDQSRTSCMYGFMGRAQFCFHRDGRLRRDGQRHHGGLGRLEPSAGACRPGRRARRVGPQRHPRRRRVHRRGFRQHLGRRSAECGLRRPARHVPQYRHAAR